MTTKSNKPSTLYVSALMLLVTVLIASSFPVGAAITHAMVPEVMMFIRFLVAAVLFAPYIIIKHGLNIPPVKTLFGYGCLSIPLVVFFWCMFEALRYTSPINTGALYTIVPAITAVFAFIINKDIAGKRRILGLLVGTLGALWIVFRGDLDAVLDLTLNEGDVIFLAGCLFMGLYNPLVKKLYSGEPMIIMTFWVILLGAGWLLILSANDVAKVQWTLIEAEVYAGIIYLSIFTTLLTFFLIQFCTVKIGPTKVAAFGFLTPVFVIPLSVLFGVGVFEWATFPGICLVLVAMFLIQKSSEVQPSIDAPTII